MISYLMRGGRVVEFKNFSKQELFLANIHELRKLGQKVGVKSPSSLNKDELVDSIYAIITGAKEPAMKKDNRGRPSKNIDISFMDFANPRLRVASQTTDNYRTLNAIESELEKGVFVLDGGHGRIRKYAFVSSDNDPFVAPNLIQDYGLRDFDVVEYLLTDKYSQIKNVSNIITVNGKHLVNKEIVFNRLDKTPARNSSFCLMLGERKICIKKGGRTLVLSTETFEGTNSGDEICYALSANAKNIAIKLNLDKEEVATNQKDNLKVFSAMVVDSPIKVQEVIDQAFVEAKSGVVEGKNVYLIIDGLEAWWNSLQLNNKETALVTLKRMLFLAGFYENNATLSLVCLSNGEMATIQPEIINYFNSKL